MKLSRVSHRYVFACTHQLQIDAISMINAYRFVVMGIPYSYSRPRERNDIRMYVLLPVMPLPGTRLHRYDPPIPRPTLVARAVMDARLAFRARVEHVEHVAKRVDRYFLCTHRHTCTVPLCPLAVGIHASQRL